MYYTLTTERYLSLEEINFSVISYVYFVKLLDYFITSY